MWLAVPQGQELPAQGFNPTVSLLNSHLLTASASTRSKVAALDRVRSTALAA